MVDIGLRRAGDIERNFDMASNGFVKLLTSAKAIVFILLTILALVTWLLAMNGNVKQNIKQLDINMPKIQENRENVIRLRSDVTHIKGAVDRIEEKL